MLLRGLRLELSVVDMSGRAKALHAGRRSVWFGVLPRWRTKGLRPVPAQCHTCLTTCHCADSKEQAITPSLKDPPSHPRDVHNEQARAFRQDRM